MVERRLVERSNFPGRYLTLVQCRLVAFSLGSFFNLSNYEVNKSFFRKVMRYRDKTIKERYRN